MATRLPEPEKAGTLHADTPESHTPPELSKNEGVTDRDAELTGANAQFAHIDEKKVLRKMDIRLIPMLALLYLLSFLDRGNIGNAKIEGLVEDLNMTGPQYNWTCRTSREPFCLYIANIN
jgi:hypothetical protein